MATPAVRNYVRRAFDRMARRIDAEVLVEKTCANSLRVGFVDRIIPDARYIHIRRAGADAAASARKRWNAGMDVGYLLRKARFVPASDLPYYASRFAWSRLYRLLSREQRLAFWGPALDNMDELLAAHKLVEVCAHQWARCVSRAEADLAAIPSDRVLRLRYEEFVADPRSGLERILAFLGVEAAADDVARAVQPVNQGSLGKAARSLDPAELAAVEAIVGPVERAAP